MAEIVRRRSWGGVLPLGRHVSISGSSFIQCASASIAPPRPGRAKCYPGAEVQGRTGSNRNYPFVEVSAGIVAEPACSEGATVAGLWVAYDAGEERNAIGRAHRIACHTCDTIDQGSD